MAEAAKRRKTTVFSLGHSNTPLDVFIETIRRANVQTLVDIRSNPRSKANPQFNRTDLMERLPAFGITYHHIKELGGHNHSKPGMRRSPNTGLAKPWREFADYMLTEDFERGMNQLMALASLGQVAVFCAEGDWKKCHRRYLADALTSKGIAVVHLGEEGERTVHVLSPGIEVKKDRITYPAAGEQLSLF